MNAFKYRASLVAISLAIGSQSALSFNALNANSQKYEILNQDTVNISAVILNQVAEFTGNEDSLIEISTANLAINYDGAEPTETRLQIEPSENGEYTRVNKGAIQASPNFNGILNVSLSLVTPEGKSAPFQATVNVVAQNDAPQAIDDVAEAVRGNTITINALANDLEFDAGDTLSVSAGETSAKGGSVRVLSDGTLSYTAPTLAEEGNSESDNIDIIKYTVSDQSGAFSKAFVSIALNDPNAVDDSDETPDDSPVQGDESPSDDGNNDGNDTPAEQDSTSNDDISTSERDSTAAGSINYWLLLATAGLALFRRKTRNKS